MMTETFQLRAMKKKPKTAQLQIRVSEAQKAALRKLAKRAGMTLSDWVLSRALPPLGETFQDLIRALSSAEKPGYVLAELNDLLTRLTPDEYRLAVSEPPRAQLAPYSGNYVAAMIEHAAAKKKTEAPSWTADVRPLAEPIFGSSLTSLRLHLLTHSPLPFRRRNIFIDSSIGDRV
jgi:hypothetical protein